MPRRIDIALRDIEFGVWMLRMMHNIISDAAVVLDLPEGNEVDLAILELDKRIDELDAAFTGVDTRGS